MRLEDWIDIGINGLPDSQLIGLLKAIQRRWGLEELLRVVSGFETDDEEVPNER